VTQETVDIFRGHGPAWRKVNAGHISLEQLKVMSAIAPAAEAVVGIVGAKSVQRRYP
jgi:hypothetical protein